jgi:hypothetical protein
MLHQTNHLPDVDVTFKPQNQFNTSKLALNIEGRPLANLVPLTLHMISVVPQDWKHMFLGTNESIAHMNASNEIRWHVESGRLELKLIPENMTKMVDGETTSQFLTTLYLYEEVIKPAEHLLLWQTDSMSNFTIQPSDIAACRVY